MIRGQPLTTLHILGRFPLDLFINGEDFFVYLGRGFCVCGLSGVIVDLECLLIFVRFNHFFHLFLFLPNLEKCKTFSISDCDSFRILLNNGWMRLVSPNFFFKSKNNSCDTFFFTIG